jgi:CubicO group peptidase (beta-lactamase class C family)
MDAANPSEIGLDADKLKKLGDSVQSDIDQGRVLGAAVLVARGGKIGYKACFGTVAPGRSAAEGDLYLQMSMSKTYTAALTLRAVDEGRFRLDTRVADLLPEFGSRGKERATIFQLLNHTAGLPTSMVPPPLPLTAFKDLAARMRAIEKLEAAYEPGTRCAYTSGVGYDVLGAILVKTDKRKRPFWQIAEEELFEPLAMRNTSFGLAVGHPKRVPVSFTPSQRPPVAPLMERIFNEIIDEKTDYPSAAAFGDIGDIFRFTEALQGRNPDGFRLLSPGLFAQARQNTTGDLILENLPGSRFLVMRQMLKTLGLVGLVRVARSRGGARIDAAGDETFPANFTLLGGYVRGTGNYLNPAGKTASPTALAAMGGGSTGWLIDTERDLTFIFLSAGLVEGFAHPKRLERLADLAIAAVVTK